MLGAARGARDRIRKAAVALRRGAPVWFWFELCSVVERRLSLAILSFAVFECLEWAWAAPSSEPGQVREEAAIRDR